MENYDVQNVLINTKPETAFNYLVDPQNLTRWTNAFKKIEGSQATMITPNGEFEITLDVKSSREKGTIDWYMTFPNGDEGVAYSRITPNDNGNTSVYSFVLMAPPVPLEMLEGTLQEQKETLTKELNELKRILK